MVLYTCYMNKQGLNDQISKFRIRTAGATNLLKLTTECKLNEQVPIHFDVLYLTIPSDQAYAEAKATKAETILNRKRKTNNQTNIRIQCIIIIHHLSTRPQHWTRSTKAPIPSDPGKLLIIPIFLHILAHLLLYKKHSKLAILNQELKKNWHDWVQNPPWGEWVGATGWHVAEGDEAGLDGVGVAGEHGERLAAVAEELLEGDGAERHRLEPRQVGARRLRPPFQPLQEPPRRRLCITGSHTAPTPREHRIPKP